MPSKLLRIYTPVIEKVDKLAKITGPHTTLTPVDYGTTADLKSFINCLY